MANMDYPSLSPSHAALCRHLDFLNEDHGEYREFSDVEIPIDGFFAFVGGTYNREADYTSDEAEVTFDYVLILDDEGNEIADYEKKEIPKELFGDLEQAIQNMACNSADDIK